MTDKEMKECEYKKDGYSGKVLNIAQSVIDKIRALENDNNDKPMKTREEIEERVCKLKNGKKAFPDNVIANSTNDIIIDVLEWVLSKDNHI